MTGVLWTGQNHMENARPAQIRDEIRKPFWRSFALMALVIFFVTLFSVSFYFRGAIYGFIDILADYIRMNEVAGGFIFVAVSALSAVLSPLSSVPMIPSAILVWGHSLTLVLLLSGWLLGGVISYGLGYLTSQKVIRRFYSFEKVEYYKKKLSSRTQFSLVFMFRMALPSEVGGYTLGIIKYHFGKYMLATFLAETPFAFLSVYSGTALIAGQVLVFAFLIVLWIILVGVMSHIFRKNIER